MSSVIINGRAVKSELLPIRIYQTTYISNDIYDVIEQKDISSYAKNRTKKELDKLKDLKYNEIRREKYDKKMKDICEFFLNCYSGKLDEEEINSKRLSLIYADFKLKANHIMSKVKEERKHDYAEVQEEIRCLLFNKLWKTELLSTTYLNEYELSDEELDPKEKLDKLSNYKYNMCELIYNTCMLECSEYIKKEVKEEMKAEEAIINKSIKDLIDSEEDKYKKYYKNNVTNLFNAVVKSTSTSINFVDRHTYIYLVNPGSFNYDNGYISFESGHLLNNRATFTSSSEDYFVRYGDTFTYVINEGGKK